MKHPPSRLVLALTLASSAAVAAIGACTGETTDTPETALPDAGFGLDASAKDSTAPDAASGKDSGTTPTDAGVADAAVVDAALDAASDASDASADATPDVLVPPACVDDAGALGDAATDGGPDAGCYAALPLFNTGVGAVGGALDGGAVDPHYTLIQSADTTLTGPDAVVASQIAAGYWIPESPESSWIAPSPNQSYPGASPCNAAGTYVYRTTFSLAGLDPATAVIQGKWAADNKGVDIRLNGTSLGITAGSYSPFFPFTITSGFTSGTNTLEFEIEDFGCPNGLRVEMVGFARVLP